MTVNLKQATWILKQKNWPRLLAWTSFGATFVRAAQTTLGSSPPKPSLFRCLEPRASCFWCPNCKHLGAWRLHWKGIARNSERFFPPLEYHLTMQNFRCLILQWRNIRPKRNQPSWFMIFQNLCVCVCPRGDALICTRLRLIQEGFP